MSIKRTSVIASKLATILGCHLCLAGVSKLPTNTQGANLAQENPIRLRSAVEAVGRRVMQRYADKESAQFGILNVTKSPYSADPTGKKDATQAIRNAMKDARDARLITFLPGGTYRVSDTITCVEGVVVQDYWLSNTHAARGDPLASSESVMLVGDSFPCVLMGSRSSQRTKIVLAPRSAGFGDTRKPKPVIYFWARNANEFEDEGEAPDPNEPNPSISYNQMIVDVDLVLGEGNPGAVGIEHQGAQGSVIENVSVDATGAFAGIQRAPGSGGGIHGLTIFGGRFGLYLRDSSSAESPGAPQSFWRGAQPVPVISNLTLKGQTELAILYDGRGPLTVVGGSIEGAGVQAQGPQDTPWNGAMNFIDTVFRTPLPCTISTNHSVYLHNVYFKDSKARAIVCVKGQPQLEGGLGTWADVEEYAAGANVQYPDRLGGFMQQDAIYLNGQPVPSGRLLRPQISTTAPPEDLHTRHAWLPLPSWHSNGVVNVQNDPYRAKGDGKTDDAAAIQRAIDESDAVFLPKGEYRLSRPLLLRSKTRLFGTTSVLSVLSAMPSTAFTSQEGPVPLVETVDDPDASTELAFVELRVPITNPAMYALRWRAGRNSVVRDVRPILTFWNPAYFSARSAFNPIVRIEGSGGGRWYNLYQDISWSQTPDYRHLLVDGTHEPLSFYMLNPEHASSDAQVEFRNARNVNVYSLKSEGLFTVLWMHGCRDVHLYGFGGIVQPRPGWPIFRIDNSHGLDLVNLDPDETFSFTPYPRPYPSQWFLITESSPDEQTSVHVRGSAQIVLYKRDNR